MKTKYVNSENPQDKGTIDISFPTPLEEEGKLFDEKYPIGTFGYSDTEDRNSLKSFLLASHKRVLGRVVDMVKEHLEHEGAKATDCLSDIIGVLQESITDKNV